MAAELNLKTLKNMPYKWQVVISVLPSLIIVLLFVFFVFKPKTEMLMTLKAKSLLLDTEISQSEAKIKILDELIVENKQLREKLQKLKEQLPEEKEVSELLKQISDLGLQSGLEILLWKPQARKTDPQNLYVEIPVNVEVVAEYHKLGVFYSHISRLPRIVNISDIDLRIKQGKDQEGKGVIAAKFTARTFASVVQAGAGATQKKKTAGIP
ncbi:MAG: type 4a pilus biogenesis protein PilO [Nitrospiraceae bacterium]|nr:MAG: type 4a pilus biogenesis protein PilO [Nitrospiraceae bacterium]